MNSKLEIWGGIECSIVRIGGQVRNQLDDTGHALRPDDIKLIAGLGIKTLRYPIPWALIEPAPGVYHWEWIDNQLGALREHGISPIAGFIHHGSGPAWTDFSDPGLPDKLGHFAKQVARRYPWIDQYTPINEPLATARLSGLYGHWHPHARDERICFQILMAECQGIAAAMRAIRSVNPAARLIQTEDFGRTYGTAVLSDQVTYENMRRWLSLDLLTGRVNRAHAFFERLIDAGIAERILRTAVEQPCVPDIVGLDYYLTSDRFLDHRVEAHPLEIVGGNGRDSYVDISASHSDRRLDKAGLFHRITEVWDRYQLPLAITEIHNGSTRDDHVRWLMHGWNAALSAQRHGIDIRAVTSWSLFGAMDWNTLMTHRQGNYECGAFDARYSPPQPTVVASAIRDMARDGHFDHPVLDTAGWWPECHRPPQNARALMLISSPDAVQAVEQCCRNRRLGCRRWNSAHELPDSEIWATLRFEMDDQTEISATCQFHCIYPNGARMTLQVPNEDWANYIDTFLDLVVDQRTGSLRCQAPAQSLSQNALVTVVDQADDPPPSDFLIWERGTANQSSYRMLRE